MTTCSPRAFCSFLMLSSYEYTDIQCIEIYLNDITKLSGEI